jgi:hypothetical protein
MKNARTLLSTLLSLILLILPSISVIQAQNTSGGNVSVQISKDSAALVAGDWVEFTTLLRNDGAGATPPLVAHLNIAAVKRGRYVDPEDWSPKRTQYLPPLEPGDSHQLNWRVHALAEGEFASFVTVVSPEESFEPVVGKSLLLHVEPDNILPLSDVIPVVAVVPFFPLALLLWNTVRNRRQRQVAS